MLQQENYVVLSFTVARNETFRRQAWHAFKSADLALKSAIAHERQGKAVIIAARNGKPIQPADIVVALGQASHPVTVAYALAEFNAGLWGAHPANGAAASGDNDRAEAPGRRTSRRPNVQVRSEDTHAP